jgi:hypothetical protein
MDVIDEYNKYVNRAREITSVDMLFIGNKLKQEEKEKMILERIDRHIMNLILLNEYKIRI